MKTGFPCAKRATHYDTMISRSPKASMQGPPNVPGDKKGKRKEKEKKNGKKVQKKKRLIEEKKN